MIRPATVYDVPRIQEIINSHAELGRMLFKSLAQLYEDLRDFAVYEEDGAILGCVGLTIIWADLAEVRSLAVDGNHQGRGIGKQLDVLLLESRLVIQHTETTLTSGRARRVIFKQDELQKPVGILGVAIVVCVLRKLENIMVRVLEDVPIVELPAATPTPKGVSIPVLEYAEED